ncbi:MAG TPA: sigma-70 family RNA polymerase sigma factor [bacterium]
MKNPKLLVEKILSGNIEEFKTLVEEHQRLVSHIVFRMIPKHADQEDICQDVFIQIYQNLGSFKFESKLSTWIARIAYNRCINYLEKKKTPLFDDLSPEEETIETQSEDSIAPDTFTEHQDRSSRLQVEIDKLPIQYRSILTLYHLDEMKYNEIAEITGLPEGTVKSYLFRARKQLKERLLKKYVVEELV